jgi:hypothetical protein
MRKDASAPVDLSDPEGKKQHVIEVCNFVDAGTSILLSAQVHPDFHAETAFQAVVAFLRQDGLPTMLTFDRDPRWVGSATQRDFPSALVQFLYCIGVQPNILPPHHPELNAFVESYHRSFKEEALLRQRPGTLEEVREVTENYQRHYNLERPHQGRSCHHQPPMVAHPTLPTLPPLPEQVDPDCWLLALDGRFYPRRVKADGRVLVDGISYYVKQALAGHVIMLRLNASARCLDVLQGEQVIKQLPIKGLLGKRLPLESYIELMSERARSEERQRLMNLRRQQRQAQAG